MYASVCALDIHVAYFCVSYLSYFCCPLFFTLLTGILFSPDKHRPTIRPLYSPCDRRLTTLPDTPRQTTDTTLSR